ncbi:hypothetical protein LUX57_49790 [Actinomadura madurae]|nr:hypothetical protein [Actinomadura madurae]MCP9972183.1 hypothetical protein [Actinomadura madurae]MCP9984684.1 hypothetical protein [Actinomadura madurae]
MDERSAAAVEHGGDGRAGRPDVSEQVELQRRRPVRVGRVEESGTHRGGAGVVHQDVDPAERLGRRRDQRRRGVRFAQVRGEGQDAVGAAEFAEGVDAEIRPRDERARRVEVPRAGESDAAARARHEGHPSRQALLHVSPPSHRSLSP